MELKRFDSYRNYVFTQYKTARRRQPGPFFTSTEFDKMAEWMLRHFTGGRLRGVCHGARAGVECDEFVKRLPKAQVFGTDLLPYSGRSAIAPGESKVIRHDFQRSNANWVGAFDFVYSNSLDHARWPIRTLKVWLNQLNGRGRLFVQWCKGKALMGGEGSGDCFAAGLEEYIDVLNEVGQVHDLLYTKTVKDRSDRLKKHGLESIVIVAGKGEADGSST